MSRKSRNIIALIINALIVLFAIASIVLSLLEGTPYYFGLQTFKYYTTLSNLFLAVACFISLMDNFKRLFKKEVLTSKVKTLIKYYATITTSITFLVVVVILGPLVGYKPLFDAPQNMIFHSVSPILGIISLLIFDINEKIDMRHTFYAFIPTICYTIFYASYMFTTKDDFYSFNSKGTLMLVLIAVAIFAMNYIFAVLYRYINNKHYYK